MDAENGAESLPAEDQVKAVSPVPSPAATESPASFAGNSHDVLVIVSTTVAGISGLCCMTGGYGLYCIPVLGIVLGAIGVVNARASLNPDRTRRWGWISVGVSGAVLLVIGLLLLCYILFIMFYLGMFAWLATNVHPTPTRFR